MAGTYSYRVQKKKSRSMAYLILAIVLVFVMFKWGLPLFIDILAGPEKELKTSQNDDNLPPQSPILSALPEATNSASLAVEGFTEANAEVTLYINDEQAGLDRADTEGAFLIDIKLTDGENKILVKARDAAGNESESALKTIVFDVSPVEITIDSPKDGDEFFGKNNQTIVISGVVNKSDARLTINGSFARLNSGGKFSQSFRLSEGENVITLKARGEAGNEKEKIIKVKFTL